VKELPLLGWLTCKKGTILGLDISEIESSHSRPQLERIENASRHRILNAFPDLAETITGKK